MEQDVQVIRNEAEERFEVRLGDDLAMIEYILQPERKLIIFTHTEVPGAFEGRGIASRMAAAALGYARDQGLKVSSLCSYIDVWMRRHPEYDDLRIK